MTMRWISKGLSSAILSSQLLMYQSKDVSVRFEAAIMTQVEELSLALYLWYTTVCRMDHGSRTGLLLSSAYLSPYAISRRVSLENTIEATGSTKAGAQLTARFLFIGRHTPEAQLRGPDIVLSMLCPKEEYEFLESRKYNKLGHQRLEELPGHLQATV